MGTVFELTPDGQGGWTYHEIYTAIGGNAIAIDGQGNLYSSVDIVSGGIVELSPGWGGTWVESHAYGFHRHLRRIGPQWREHRCQWQRLRHDPQRRRVRIWHGL